MCMMEKNGENNSCDVAKSLSALDDRVTNVEGRLDKMEGSLNDGFKQLSTAVNTLGHDFGSRMNVMELRIVTEKEKWGETLRWTVKVIVRVLCALALAAGGITVCKLFFAT